ncbi:MBL fold metallo-hydrolase, partial [Flavobacterium sp. 3-210]
ALCVSQSIREGETLNVDGIELQALYTPGHTDESFSFVLNPAKPEAVFSGDVLLIRGSGRTDFQGGDPRKSYDSIVNKL